MLDIYADGYNTNIRKALSVALDELLENGEDNALKSIVLISDGGTECEGDVLSYDRDVLERAQKADVKIYTVAVGSNPATENLKEIAETTDGLEFTSTVNNAVTIANTVFSHRTENYFKTKPANLIKRKYILGSWQYLIDLKKRVQDCFPEGNPNYLMIAKKQIQLMMQDYYDYAKLDDPENIVDEIWDDYCTEFNNAVRGYGFVEEDVHYFRNKLNRAPATRDELIADKKSWILLGIGDSLYHMHGSDDALFNTKFISNDKDGKYECVYDKEGVLLTEGNDPQNMGTYNYYGPSLDRLIHAYFDVIPYYRWGNIEGCPAVESRNPNDFYSNFEAQEAYKKIENMMK